MKTPIFYLPLLPLLGHAATLDDLWITEVVPSTGQVEITNTGAATVVTMFPLPFCHRFQYADVIPSETSFVAGESKVFTLGFSNVADSDLWLYRVGGAFGTASNIITGLKWGPAAGVGRTGIATTAGKWDGVGIAAPAPGMALHLVAPDPTKSTSWQVAAPDLGQHAFPLSALSMQLGETEVQLTWEGGSPPFRVETSKGLSKWKALTGLLTERNHAGERSGTEDRRFFRVVDQVMLEESAEYRITFTSLWSSDRFAIVPGSAHFSGLIGGMHDDGVLFWMPGTNASPGIKSMAETGSKAALLGEVNAAINAGQAQQVLSGNGLGGAPSETTLSFTASRSHPLLTITSMIAPSPDWFVGVHGVSLLQENDDWVGFLSFDLLAYDAGTDSGTSFTASNQMTNPADPISLIPATDSNFAPASGPAGDPIPITRLVIERMGD